MLFYLQVYILCPVFLRFGGSICRCLVRWVDAPILEDPDDCSYWVPPQHIGGDKFNQSEITETIMCSKCLDDSETKYYSEKIMGLHNKPLLEIWTLGDPRFNDKENPLFAPHQSPDDDWRTILTVELYRDFYNYAHYKYGSADSKCSECLNLKKKRDKVIHVCRPSKKKKKKQNQEEFKKDLEEVKECIDSLESLGSSVDCETKIKDILKEKPRVREALEEVKC